MSKPSNRRSSPDELLESWAAVTATSQPPGSLRARPRPSVAWLVPALAGLLVVAVVGVLLVGSRPRSPEQTVGPTASAPTTSPVVECDGGVDQATCDAATALALKTVKPSGWTPTQVWISSGLFCPHEECLFDPNANFPMAIPPDGGQWAANAEIAFAETDKHAGINIAQTGSGLVAVFIGYKVPALTWCSGTCPSSVAHDGLFKLELVMPHLGWKVGDPISGTAILSYAGASPSEIWGSGSSLIWFSYTEVNGPRHVSAIPTADCRNHPIDPATPITTPLTKGGAYGTGDPNDDFVRSFLAGSDVLLPAGTWNITAIADFADGSGCGSSHHLATTLRITVGDVSLPVSTPTQPLPTAEPTATPLSAADAATLATGAWVNPTFDTGAWEFDFGRLDGRHFHFAPPRYGDVTRPANDGTFIAWWGDSAGNDTVVELVDSATGSMRELTRVPIAIYAAAISPLADAWYWVPSKTDNLRCPGGEPCRPDANGLWRQALPGGKPEKVADWNGSAAAVTPSADGSEILIVDPEPATDTGPVHYHVWYAGSRKLYDLPVTEDTEFGLFDGKVLLHKYAGSLADIVAVDPATSTSEQLPVDPHYFNAEVDMAADGSERLVYLAPNGSNLLTLYELAPISSQSTTLYQSAYAFKDGEPLAQSLSGGLSDGRINIPGWVPFIGAAGEYTTGGSPGEATAPSQVVNLDNGQVITLPPLGAPVEAAIQ